jgi:protein RecA
VKLFLDTGFMPLNKAISGVYDGGMPVGRLVEMFGPPSSGKCQPASTMVLSEYGMTTIGELFELCGYKATCTSREVEHSVGMINENGELENTSHLTWNGRKKIKCIRTSSGMTVEATHRHPLRVMNEHGFIVWRHADKIVKGDQMVVMRGPGAFGRNDLTPDEAKLLGYLIADGSLNNEYRLSFSNSDKEVEAEYKRLLKLVAPDANVTTTAKIDSKTTDHVTDSKNIRSLFAEKYGLGLTTAKGKSVPLVVRQAGREAQIAFLRGYFELECHVDAENGIIEVVSASKELIRQVQLMLLNLGILARSAPKEVEGYEHIYTRLVVGSQSTRTFLDVIGFETTERKTVAGKLVAKTRGSSVDVVPNVSGLLRSLYDTSETDREGNDLCYKFMASEENARGLNYEALENILEYFEKRKTQMNAHLISYFRWLVDRRFVFDEVVSIEDDEAPTFDVSLPETHSFWANGFVSHNTAIATNVMTAAQRAGGIAAFMDHERSFDVGLGKSFGLDDTPGKWVFKTPETFEQSVDYTKKLMKVVRDKALIHPDAPIVIVFDSLAAMVPQSILTDSKGNERDASQRNMNDNTALARATSAHFPALAMLAEKYNALLLFLNQARTKIGVMYGDPTTTPGGNAPEFYMSVRIKLGRKMLTSGSGSDKKTVGQQIGAECVKNKVSRPFEKAAWNFMFKEDGSGFFDVIGSTVDHACDIGVLKQSGPRVEWIDGTNHFKGTLAEKIIEDGSQDELFGLLRDHEAKLLGRAA